MKDTKRILTLLLTAVMLSSTMLSCSNKGSNETTPSGTDNPSQVDQSTSEGESDSENEGDTTEKLDIPFTQYNGYTFTSLNADNQTYNYRELVVEDLTGEGINDAFYNRNLAVEDLLDIKITSVVNASGGNLAAFKNSVNAADGAYDCAFMNFSDAGGVASGGYCLDLNRIPNIDLTKSWWSQDSVNQLRVLGSNYLAASDITIGDKDCMWVLFFDKAYFADLHLEDPYELVAEGKWTFDKFYEMLKQGLADLNGNGVYDTKDRWGLLTHSENYAGMWMSAGQALVSLDDKDVPQMTWNSEQFINVWEKICTIMGDEAVYSDSIDYITSGLREGNALFATEVVAFIRAYRENEREFGILPMPKYDENQDRYYTYVAVNSDLMVVSKAISDPSCTGEILECLAGKGKEIIMPAYYDVSLKSRSARDSESAASLDIIFANRMYDLGVVFNWGGVKNHLNNPDANVPTIWAKLNKAMNKSMQATIQNFEEAMDEEYN